MEAILIEEDWNESRINLAACGIAGGVWDKCRGYIGARLPSKFHLAGKGQNVQKILFHNEKTE